MITRNIVKKILDTGFQYISSSNPNFIFFSKTEDSIFNCIVLVDNTTSISFGYDEFSAISNSLENTFLLKGFTKVNVLFVIFTKNPYELAYLNQKEINFWIADVNTLRIISYENSPYDFCGLRDTLEKSLSEDINASPEAKKKFRKHINFKSIPVITIIIAVINILIFMCLEFTGGTENAYFMSQHGALSWPAVIYDHSYYILITAMFLHFGFDHLFNNMVSLLVIGTLLEPGLNKLSFLLIYFMSGIGGNIASVLYNYNIGAASISAGASGAIFGLFGAYAIVMLFSKVRGHEFEFRRILILTILMCYNSMLNPTVDNAAHLGGLIFGTVTAFICCICRKNKI